MHIEQIYFSEDEIETIRGFDKDKIVKIEEDMKLLKEKLLKEKEKLQNLF